MFCGFMFVFNCDIFINVQLLLISLVLCFVNLSLIFDSACLNICPRPLASAPE